jgi:hypothetical protein
MIIRYLNMLRPFERFRDRMILSLLVAVFLVAVCAVSCLVVPPLSWGDFGRALGVIGLAWGAAAFLGELIVRATK